MLLAWALRSSYSSWSVHLVQVLVTFMILCLIIISPFLHYVPLLFHQFLTFLPLNQLYLKSQSLKRSWILHIVLLNKLMLPPIKINLEQITQNTLTKLGRLWNRVNQLRTTSWTALWTPKTASGCTAPRFSSPKWYCSCVSAVDALVSCFQLQY